MKCPLFRFLTVGLPLLCAALGNGCGSAATTADLPAVQNFELAKYLGRWYEIARLPHRFERGMTNCRADYTRRPDGRVRVLNAGTRNGELHSVEGTARFRAATDIGELEVSFFGPFYGGYRIIRLTPDYSIAAVTSDTRDYLWILARDPHLPQPTRDAWVEWLKNRNFAVENLEFPVTP